MAAPMRLPIIPPIAAPVMVPTARLPVAPPIALPITAPAPAPTRVPPTCFGPASDEHAATAAPSHATATTAAAAAPGGGPAACFGPATGGAPPPRRSKPCDGHNADRKFGNHAVPSPSATNRDLITATAGQRPDAARRSPKDSDWGKTLM